MGLFDKIKEPIFLKEDSNSKKQLSDLQSLRQEAVDDLAEQLDEEISKTNFGILGEDSVHFELANSHIPMFILHDLFLQCGDLSAQIDYLIITRQHVFVIECKNLYGDIEITSSGNFVRTIKYGRQTKKEGIYSPITQNRRHLELIKQIRSDTKSNFFVKSIFEKSFYENYRSIVVLANPKTVLYDKYAKKEVKSQVIRADQLSEYIRQVDSEPGGLCLGKKDMEELAHFFLEQHKPQTVDYTQKYAERLKDQKEQAARQQVSSAEKPLACSTVPDEKPAENTESNHKTVVCPRCGAPMVKRKATRGANAGNEFYGCSRYPHCKCIINIK